MDTNMVSDDEKGNESDTEDAQSIGDDVPFDPTPREFDIDTPNLPGTAPVVVQDDEDSKGTYIPNPQLLLRTGQRRQTLQPPILGKDPKGSKTDPRHR